MGLSARNRKIGPKNRSGPENRKNLPKMGFSSDLLFRFFSPSFWVGPIAGRMFPFLGPRPWIDKTGNSSIVLPRVLQALTFTLHLPHLRLSGWFARARSQCSSEPQGENKKEVTYAFWWDCLRIAGPKSSLYVSLLARFLVGKMKRNTHTHTLKNKSPENTGAILALSCLCVWLFFVFLSLPRAHLFDLFFVAIYSNQG